MADPNPDATLAAAVIASAAATAAGPPTVATDDILTITGTLGGPLPETMGEARGSAAVAVSPGFDLQGIVKLVVIAVIASWIGQALFSGRGK